jgi:hypothetical protein
MFLALSIAIFVGLFIAVVSWGFFAYWFAAPSTSGALISRQVAYCFQFVCSL